MAKLLLFFLLLVFGLQTSQAQAPCDCSKILKNVTDEIETNSASYADQVLVQQRTKPYTKHKKSIQKISKTLTTKKECIGLIQLYLSFLKDEHQKLYPTNDYYPFTSFKDTLKVQNFVKTNVENFKIKTNIIPEGILGNWIHKNGTLKLQIQKNSDKGRTHIGILKTPYHYLGNIGDLKIEFYKNQSEELIANFWDFGQKPFVHNVVFDENSLTIGRDIKFYRNINLIPNEPTETIKNNTCFEALTDNTNYLRIHSFDYTNKEKIDSILISNTSKITSKPHLIIDLRSNGGGSDLSYKQLLPFVMDSIYYKNPTNSAVWVSPDNLKHYDNEKYLYGVKTKADSLNADLKIKNLKTHLGGFMPKTFWVSKVESIYKSPKHVYLLVDRKCASSTEGFILTAMQSSKVKIFGENTTGALSYGDWRELLFKDFPAMISMTTKKMHLINDINMESIGITPDVKLEEDAKWLDIILKKIEG